MSPRREPLVATRPATEPQDALEAAPPTEAAHDDAGATTGPELVRPMLTLTEAANLTGRNRRTLRRWLDAGKFPNAAQDDDDARTWRIPASDLEAAGRRLGITPPDDITPSRSYGHNPSPGWQPTSDSAVAELERQLAEERAARQVAEARLEGAQALADDRAAQVATLTEALAAMQRALPAGPDAAPRRRGFFRRGT